ncbi:MAG: GNAT family N-acetyltransferase [Bacilli bacterium]|nr:GNAT family N-acetyltransferase [Bacilli bacterium]
MIKSLNNIASLKQYHSDILKEQDIISEINVNPYARYLFYVENNQIIAYIYYSDIYERAEINMFEVDSKYRNNKIGNKLMEYLINNIKKDITLEVKEDNYIAIYLYEKYGFKKVAKRPGYYGKEDGILMQREYQ